MINWLHQEEGFCEGSFKSVFFHDDENGNELFVYAKSSDLSKCAEKCVDVFNNLTESEIKQICKEIIKCVKESGMDEDFDIDAFENELDILNYCWFTALYVNMLSEKDEIAFVVEGEGEWGDLIGFAVKNNQVIYVGEDYFDYMKDEE